MEPGPFGLPAPASVEGGKWWPSVVIGSNDLLTTGELNPFLIREEPLFLFRLCGRDEAFRFHGHDIGVTVGGHALPQQERE